MEYKELFGTPIHKFKFNGHADLKNNLLEYSRDDSVWQENTWRDSLKFTHPNMHREEVMKPFVTFLDKSINTVFNNLGYVPSFDISGLWMTKQPNGGNHHRHIHPNTFLAGVYYLSGPENTNGTTFYNSHSMGQIIVPAIIPGRSKLSLYEKLARHTEPFVEGTMIVFPAWLSHQTTTTHQGDDDRYIISFNIMPVGMTNQDPFGRYNYQSIESAELLDSKNEIAD